MILTKCGWVHDYSIYILRWIIPCTVSYVSDKTNCCESDRLHHRYSSCHFLFFYNDCRCTLKVLAQTHLWIFSLKVSICSRISKSLDVWKTWELIGSLVHFGKMLSLCRKAPTSTLPHLNVVLNFIGWLNSYSEENPNQSEVSTCYPLKFVMPVENQFLVLISFDLHQFFLLPFGRAFTLESSAARNSSQSLHMNRCL